MINITTYRVLASVAAAVLFAGCASEPTATERDFGNSVRQMITAQTYDKSTLSTPPEGAIENTDGQMLEGALETYRATVSDQSGLDSDIIISVGQ